MSGLSLCVIARDEGDVVSRCLESARPYVDEIVLVGHIGHEEIEGTAGEAPSTATDIPSPTPSTPPGWSPTPRSSRTRPAPRWP